MEFEETFWPTDADYIFRADPLRGHCQFSVSDTTYYSILLASVTGQQAMTVYHQTVEETKFQIMHVLKMLYGSQIPDPISITIPDWGTNPLFMGIHCKNKTVNITTR